MSMPVKSPGSATFFMFPSRKLASAIQTTVMTDSLKRRTKTASQADSPSKWRVVRETHSDDKRLRLLDWNLLSPSLVKTTQYLYRMQLMDWKQRRRKIVEAMKASKADVICVQEMDEHDYEKKFKPFLQSLAYSSCYKKRTGQNKDGIAIFVKSPIKFVKVRHVEYKQNNFMDRDNVGLIAICELDGIQFIVATTHVLFNHNRGYIKLAQLHQLLQEIKSFASESDIRMPLILTGDFNATPNSALYNFLINGHIQCTPHTREADLSGRNQGKTADVTHLRTSEKSKPAAPLASAPIDQHVHHDYTLVNAMHLADEQNSPYFTVCLARERPHQPDFVFVGTPANLVNQSQPAIHGYCFEVLKYIQPKAHRNKVTLPNANHPSDHLSLTVDLALVKRAVIAQSIVEAD